MTINRYQVDVQMLSGSLTVEIESTDEPNENEILERAILKIEEELDYAKLGSYIKL